jgi:hypothetical protein
LGKNIRENHIGEIPKGKLEVEKKPSERNPWGKPVGKTLRKTHREGEKQLRKDHRGKKRQETHWGETIEENIWRKKNYGGRL